MTKSFYILFSLHVFRAGIERKNSDGINVAKARCMPLFYGLFALRRFSGIQYCWQNVNHFLKMFSRHWVLQCVWQRLQKGGRRLCAEKLSKNKNFKRLLLSGLLDDKEWIRACRNAERITKVNNSLTYYVFYHNVS